MEAWPRAVKLNTIAKDTQGYQPLIQSKNHRPVRCVRGAGQRSVVNTAFHLFSSGAYYHHRCCELVQTEITFSLVQKIPNYQACELKTERNPPTVFQFWCGCSPLLDETKTFHQLVSCIRTADMLSQTRLNSSLYNPHVIALWKLPKMGINHLFAWKSHPVSYIKVMTRSRVFFTFQKSYQVQV